MDTRTLTAAKLSRRDHSPVVLILLTLGFVSLGLPEGSLGVAWPSMRATFGLPLDALGFLFGSFATGYIVSSAISGRLFERVGIGTALSASCALGGASLLGYATSPSWPTLVSLAGLLGLGAGTIDSGLNAYAAVRYGARVLNWMHAAFGLGAAVGPVLMTAAIETGLGWQAAYAVLAVAELALAAGYGVLRHRLSAASRPASQHEPRPAVDAHGQPTPSESPARSATAAPRLALVLSAAVFFLYVGLEATVGQWSFSLVALGDGQPATVAGFLISAYWGSLTAGRLVFGALAPHFSNRAVVRGSMAACVAASFLIALPIPALHLVAIPALGLVLAPIFPVLIAETPARLGVAATTSAVGIQVAAAVLGGAGIPGLVGVLAARGGLQVIGVCGLVTALAQLGVNEVLVRRVSARR